ncbi:unnamed protein product [Sympodiomycopsis kandeliae]
MRSSVLALFAGLSMVAASPIAQRSTDPNIYNKQGLLHVLGPVGSNYDETAEFNGNGKLALGSAGVPYSLQVVSHTANYEHAVGYVKRSAVSCVTANKATGRTSFNMETCADAAPADQKDDLRKRQTFEFTPGGDTINLALGDSAKGIESRPNVRFVSNSEIHTTPDPTNYQLYLKVQ